jgi:hypothetical protein
LNELQFALQSLTPSGTGVWVLVAMLALTLVKGWPKLKAIQVGADDSLRHDLLEEIARLRADIVAARAESAAERLLGDARLAAAEVKHSAQLAAIGKRHDLRVAAMEDEIRGMRAQMQQIIESVGRPAHAPTVLAAVIDKAYPLPRDMRELRDELDEEGQ